MVILVFLVDTSASMNQKTCLGTTYLDLAKGAVESFLKIRARDINASRGDRYMLVTFDEHNKSVKVGWRENLAQFLKELKNLEAYGLTDLGGALKQAFDLLNMTRLQSGIDNYGLGRNPYYLEPALVMLFSDGCDLINVNGITGEIIVPSNNQLPGAELTKEIYRWDQRLFALNLKIPGFAASVNEKLSTLQAEDMALSNLCEDTGGKLYSIGSYKTLLQSLESIAQKIAVPGVIINFEKHGPDPEPILKDGSKTPKTEEESVSPALDNNGILPISFNSTVPLMNGFLSHSNRLLNENIMNGNLNNSFLPTDSNGNIALGGLLLPPPILHPGMIPPPPLPVGMLSKGLHPPPMSSILQSMSFPSHINIPVKNVIPTRIMNGKIEAESAKVIPKTDAQNTSVSVIPENPIRGDEHPDLHSDMVSPVSVLSPSTAWTKQRRMIFVRTNIKGTVGHWPIPESYWPDSSMIALPPRDSHPVIKFQCKPCEAMIIDNLPFDKYELEPSPLTQYILERKQPNIAWQVFVSGSSCDSEIGYPFGYLKAATNLLCVNLFVLPYNYPVVMPLIDELIKVHKCKPSPKWQQSFEQYLRKMPSYYIVSLQNAFKRMGVTNNLIPDHFDGSLNYNILSYMKRIKHLGKNEAERLINIHSQQSTVDPIKITLPYAPQLTDGKQKDFKAFLLKENVAINRMKPEPIDDKTKMTTEEAQFFMSRNLPALVDRFQVQSYKNPFDIHRGDIIDHVNRMRANFFQMPNILSSRMHDEELKHCISISMMGNYKEPELQQVKPLREVDSSQIRLHTFGNPFKLKEQDQQFIVDEADESAFNQNPRKRLNEPLALKVKRKRNDSAPSRRPVGRPNTPPPKLISFSKLEPVKNIINQVIDQKCLKSEDTYVKNNSKDSKVVNKKDDKKLTSISVNDQLRKLQKMHRKRKVNNLNNDEKLDAESTLVSSSTNVPIFSLEVPKESLIANDVNNLSNHSLKQARLELQKKYPVKIRLEVWKALRERKDFQFILNLLESLNVSSNAKFLFINELIDESNRFQLHSLVKKLETLLQNLVISEKS
ncbi:integrator complex subunit 6 isoform X2 [Hydra vulgaris]|uniref:Integrator complex subunit 6 isoform X2 n=1 Tax=Hydra vulgaris TaxID=6087 RepID=A0ABM4B8A0_HYDVU